MATRPLAQQHDYLKCAQFGTADSYIRLYLTWIPIVKGIAYGLHWTAASYWPSGLEVTRRQLAYSHWRRRQFRGHAIFQAAVISLDGGRVYHVIRARHVLSRQVFICPRDSW